MPRQSAETKSKILDEYHLGKTQHDLARIYNCSPATVNKICKGVVPKYIEKMNTMASIKSDLYGESEFLSERFDKGLEKKVNDEIRRRDDEIRRRDGVFNTAEQIIVRSAQMLNKNKTVEKVSQGNGIQGFSERELNSSDLKNISETVDKASLTLGVNTRHSNTNVVLSSNQNNIGEVKNLEDFYDEA